MGIGYSANYADVVSEDWVKEVAPKEFDNFKNALEKVEVDIEVFARDNQYGGSDEVDWGDEVDQTYDALVTKFKESTGLDLEIYYHDSENEGDRYDDVNGVFWMVSGVYQLTEAGEKHKDRITRAFYVTFG
jgi:hypothetical protein